AQVAVFAMCAFGGRSPRLAHIAKGAMYAPPSGGGRWRAFTEGIGWRTGGGVCHVCVRRPVAAARTHRKKRDVCATQWGHPQKGWVTHTWGGFPCCAFGGRSSRLAHIAKKRDVCATQWIGWAE